jgi:hypothetical protein
MGTLTGMSGMPPGIPPIPSMIAIVKKSEYGMQETCLPCRDMLRKWKARQGSTGGGLGGNDGGVAVAVATEEAAFGG